MPRAKTRVPSRARRKKILKRAKGYWGRRKSNLQIAKQSVDRAGSYAYRDRRTKKRKARELWIVKINAACRINDMSYSTFMNGLKKANIEVDRKILAHIAENDPTAFAEMVKLAKAA